MTELEKIFSTKLTENGDKAYTTTGNAFLDILFGAEYYTKHLAAIPDLSSDNGLEKLFAMFIRDPRHGLGYRELGRVLMHKYRVSAENIVRCGRYDDVWLIKNAVFDRYIHWYADRLKEGDFLAKKWAPRYSSKNKFAAQIFAHRLGMNKQEYGHFIKCSTPEYHLSHKTTDEIDFEKLPSLALLKYYNRFSKGSDTKERFHQYINDVKSGKRDIKLSTTTIYDIYKNRDKIDADLFFSKIEKIQGSWIPVVDTSGSMCDDHDSIGKALAVGHYLAKCSTYCPNQVLSFSSRPQLITLGEANHQNLPFYYDEIYNNPQSAYMSEIRSMITGDCSNTDFGAVMDRLSELEKDFPEYLVVLSDMEFDRGSANKKDDLMREWKRRGIKTKIVWWNFNSRNFTTPETDQYGNIFMAGYKPQMLRFLESGFDGMRFLLRLLGDYANTMNIDINKLEEL